MFLYHTVVYVLRLLVGQNKNFVQIESIKKPVLALPETSGCSTGPFAPNTAFLADPLFLLIIRF